MKQVNPKVYYVVITNDRSLRRKRMLMVTTRVNAIKLAARQFARGNSYRIEMHNSYLSIVDKMPFEIVDFEPQPAVYSILFSNMNKTGSLNMRAINAKLPHELVEVDDYRLKLAQAKAKRWCARNGEEFGVVFCVEFKSW